MALEERSSVDPAFRERLAELLRNPAYGVLSTLDLAEKFVMVLIDEICAHLLQDDALSDPYVLESACPSMWAAFEHLIYAHDHLMDGQAGVWADRRDWEIYGIVGPDPAEAGALYYEIGGLQYVGLTRQASPRHRLHGQRAQAKNGAPGGVHEFLRQLHAHGFEERRVVLVRLLHETEAKAKQVEDEQIEQARAMAQKLGHKFRNSA